MGQPEGTEHGSLREFCLEWLGFDVPFLRCQWSWHLAEDVLFALHVFGELDAGCTVVSERVCSYIFHF